MSIQLLQRRAIARAIAISLVSASVVTGSAIASESRDVAEKGARNYRSVVLDNSASTPFLSSHGFVPSYLAAKPSAPMAPQGTAVSLVVDDGTAEDGIGLTAGGEFIWLNRFTPDPTDFPFTLNEIQVMFTSTTSVTIGDAVDLYVYSDADGDPSNGATFVGSSTGQTIQALDTFSVYPVAIPLSIVGDVLIGAVNRGSDAAGQFPAAIDLTASQVRSWVGFGTVDDPPVLPSATFGTIDSFGFAGNWLVRGEGTAGDPEPTLDIDDAGITWTDVCSTAPGQENGIAEPGETLQLEVPVTAEFGDFTDVVASLPLPAPAGVTYIVSTANIGNLADGATATASFEILVDPGFTCMASFTQSIEVTSNEGSGTGSIDVDVGQAGTPVYNPLTGTGPAVVIPDATPGGVTSTLSIAEDVSIFDIRVAVNVTHTWVGDLKISLTSPGGTTVDLLDQPGVPASTFGCSIDNVAALFGDGFAVNETVCPAGPPWPGAAPEIAPSSALAAFAGESTVGDWVLTISDNAAGDTGGLDSWSLQVAETPSAGVCTVCAGNDVIFADGFEVLVP